MSLRASLTPHRDDPRVDRGRARRLPRIDAQLHFDDALRKIESDGSFDRLTLLLLLPLVVIGTGGSLPAQRRRIRIRIRIRIRMRGVMK
jgi:hypothetical protein